MVFLSACLRVAVPPAGAETLLEMASLLQHGRWVAALGGIAVHVGGSIAATLAGFATVAALRP